MDLEDRDLAALEERLYSSIHHSYEDATPSKISAATPVPASATRIVSRTTVVNNSQAMLPANMKRYWVGSAAAAAPSAGERAPYARINPTDGMPKQSAPVANAPDTVPDGDAHATKKMFLAPYQSLLGNHHDKLSENQSPLPEDASQNQNVPKQAPKETGLQFKKKKQTKQPGQYVEKRLASLLKLIDKDRKENAMQALESKKTKANRVRQRKRTPVVIAEICINSSDEESQPVKRQMEPAESLLLSEEETDEVIIIPTPPPPQICIDCSDEEETNSGGQFALPKSKKSKTQKLAPAPSSRCHSPSNSSIMSDDFIGQHDRSRLNDSFTESIPSDDELVSTMEGNRRAGTAPGKAAKKGAEKRQERVPSISSEDTVGTNGDTTDQEKRTPETGKGHAAKPQPPVMNGGGTATNAKNKKESTSTKKTPSKGKLAKTGPASPVVEAATAPSTTPKANVNSKPANSATTSSDTSGSTPKTSAKSKTRSKSPVSLVMELVRKQFEGKKTRADGSGKKAKQKKDTASSPSDAGPRCRSKKVPLFDENVSSESDYDISLKDDSAASTPKPADKRARRSASSFIEQAANVSSESDYDESFLQTKLPAAAAAVAEKQPVEKEPKKRIGRKRKQYNSETYSDEDFACLLTDIVRAVSDTEEEEEDEEEDGEEAEEAEDESAAGGANENKEKSVPSTANIETAGEEQPAAAPSKADRNPKKKRKLKDALPPGEGTVVTTQPTDTIEMEGPQPPQPDPAGKKKKRVKEPKACVKEVTPGSSCTTPDPQTNRPEKAQPAPAAPSPAAKRKKKQTNTPNDTQTIMDSDDDDIQCIVEAPRDGARKAPPAIGPECAWNEEMKQFYNTSWAGENLDLEMVFRKMPYDTRQWHIVHRDQFPTPPKKETTCTNCGERGHMRFKCRNAPKQAICYMCGEKGHREPRCPKTICFNCGAKTRSFVRGCKSCSREADVTCFLCGERGHTQRSCPDLWRRYHSTTEDNVPLKEDFERNPRARWCSICGRSGHQAHACNDARRIFGHPIPKVIVSSYMPTYRGEFNRHSKLQTDEQDRRLAENPAARYNLLSDNANGCEFNLNELAQNEKGFYFNFLKSTGLLEKHVQFHREQEQASVQQVPSEPLAAPSPVQTTLPDPPPVVEIEIKQEETQPEPELMEQTASPAEPGQQQPTSSVVVEENSNYSFSEFNNDTVTDTPGCSNNVQQHVEDARSPPPAADLLTTERHIDQQHWLSDFIPLTVAEEPVGETAAPAAAPPKPLPSLPVAGTSPEPAPPVTENAKVLLSREHATLLLSEGGSQFLSTARIQHNIQLSISIESVGNVLLISGTPDAQTTFHGQLVQYLRETEDAARNAKYFQNKVPRHCNKMTRYIATYLRNLVRAKDSMRQTLTRLNQTTNPDTQEKYRRYLNTHLFGVYGLRDGRKHLNILRNQLALCMNANPWKGELEEYQRVIITDAIRYIFSGYDHKNYDAVVEEFEQLKRTNRLDMLTFYDLGIPRIINRPQTSEVPAKKQGAGKQGGKGAVGGGSMKKANLKAKPRKKDVSTAVGSTHSVSHAAPVANSDAFAMNNTTPFPTIDPVRLQQLDSSTRYAHETVAYPPPHCSKNWPNHDWQRDEPPRDDRSRYRWFRQPEPQPHWHHQQSLADRDSSLRNQELSQLQRLQEILRR